jgi:hypothetical protein
MNHDWKKGVDGYWVCRVCAEVSPTRRKPRKAGCLGPKYPARELSTWRFGTEFLPNHGMNLYLVDGEGKKECIRHFPRGFELSMGRVRQYTSVLNEMLDDLQEVRNRVHEFLREEV